MATKPGDLPFIATNKGLVLKWRAVLALVVLLIGIDGGSSVLASYLGIGGPSLAESLRQHERESKYREESVESRLSTCEKSVAIITKTMKNIEAVQRIQVATAEARQVTNRIRDPEDRQAEFVRVLEANIKRLMDDPPRETCHNLTCE